MEDNINKVVENYKNILKKYHGDVKDIPHETRCGTPYGLQDQMKSAPARARYAGEDPTIRCSFCKCELWPKDEVFMKYNPSYNWISQRRENVLDPLNKDDQINDRRLTEAPRQAGSVKLMMSIKPVKQNKKGKPLKQSRETKASGQLAEVSASILMSILWIARVGRFDILRAVCQLATKLTKWSFDCDYRLNK